MIVEVEGETGVGKSAFVYSAPLPLVGCAFDAGVNRALFGTVWKRWENIDIQVVKYPPALEDMSAVEKFWNRNGGRAITVYLLPQPIQISTRLQGCRELWNKFTFIATKATQSMSIASIVVDTGTIARRVAADAYLETLQNDSKTSGRQQLLEVEWGRPGDMIRSVYTAMQNQAEAFDTLGKQKHLVVTHHLTPVRQNIMDSKGEMHSVVVNNANGTPKLQMEGLGNTYRFVDVAMRMGIELVDNPMQAGSKIVTVQGVFTKCGYDLSLQGKSIVSPTWDSLANLLNRNLHPRARIELRDKEVPVK